MLGAKLAVVLLKLVNADTVDVVLERVEALQREVGYESIENKKK